MQRAKVTKRLGTIRDHDQHRQTIQGDVIVTRSSNALQQAVTAKCRGNHRSARLLADPKVALKRRPRCTALLRLPPYP